MKKLIFSLFTKRNIIFFIPLLLLILLRLPSLFEPIWYEDEGISSALATSILNGKGLYIDVWNHKPPGLYYIYVESFRFFGYQLFSVKLISLIFGIVGFYFLYKLSRLWINNNIVIFLMLLLYAFYFGTPIIESNIADAEVFFVVLDIVGIYLLVKNTRSNLLYLVSGIIFFASSIIKPPAIFDLIPILLVLFIAKKINIRKLFVFGIGFIIPWIIVSLYYFSKGVFHDFFQAIVSANLDYVTTGNTSILHISLWEVKAVITLIITFILSMFFIKKRMGFPLYLLSCWVLWDIFSILLSGRDYAHYAIQLIPSTILLAAYLIYKIQILHIKNISDLLKNNYFLLLLGTIAFIVYITMAFTPYNYSGSERTVVDNYYQSFFKYVVGVYSQNEYYSTFYIDPSLSNQPHPLRQTDLSSIAKVIDKNTTSNQCIFLWTNLPQIYTLSKRLDCSKYLVDFHISNQQDKQEDVMESLNRTPPEIILTSDNGFYFPEFQSYVNSHYKLIDMVEYISIYKHI